jgi:ABC-type sugar transport system ATPase subunit
MVSITYENVTKQFRDGTAAVCGLDLHVPHGEFMILVGPSGCGKTTALRMLAGLEDVTSGRILLGDREINDVDPGRRDIAMVFQNYALFPHMTVFDNIAFPLRMRGAKKAEAKLAVHEAAGILGLTELLKRKPNQLSGGQRQRVAMGRAIVRHPVAFLMDEPLSNLDAKLRTQMRAELARLHRNLGVTTLYVTHDQTEAMTLGTRVAVMREGLVQQVGTPQELYRAPVNSFVARFIGSPPMNVVNGTLLGGRLMGDGQPHHRDVAGEWATSDGKVHIGIRPESCRLGPGSEDEALSLVGDVEVVEDLGSEQIVYIRMDELVEEPSAGIQGVFAAKVSGTLAPRIGERVTVSAPITAIHLFDPRDGATIPRADAPVPASIGTEGIG